jgi:hypothetical protein
MNNIVPWIEKLTGQNAPLNTLPCGSFPPGGIGYGQFNELLLALGYDRVSKDFFRYIFGSNEVRTFRDLRIGVDGFRKKSMLKHGNFKYSFKCYRLASTHELKIAFDPLSPADPREFTGRHEPLLKLQPISRTEAPLLGYISDPARAEKRSIEAKGIYNHHAYLTYDHMDVYVATSMRRSIDFWNVHYFCSNLFTSPPLKDLKLRWFDPTQAYCPNRLDKGLVEALMLKRARCTIYLAQDSETLGKDSELATTLVQGKSVITYVPSLRDFDEFRTNVSEALRELHSDDADLNKALINMLQLYYPDGAWVDDKVRHWLRKPDDVDFKTVLKFIFDKANELYDKRADVLRKHHPLGLQIDLSSGVANGVLVVRTIAGCAKVLRAILLRTWEFDIEEPEADKRAADQGEGATVLRERMTGCILRAVTEDDLLTNTFWNFYGEGAWREDEVCDAEMRA